MNLKRKYVFVYFNRIELCSTPEQAIYFINSLINPRSAKQLKCSETAGGIQCGNLRPAAEPQADAPAAGLCPRGRRHAESLLRRCGAYDHHEPAA